jgi:hypothetical protein
MAAVLQQVVASMDVGPADGEEDDGHGNEDEISHSLGSPRSAATAPRTIRHLALEPLARLPSGRMSELLKTEAVE